MWGIHGCPINCIFISTVFCALYYPSATAVGRAASLRRRRRRLRAAAAGAAERRVCRKYTNLLQTFSEFRTIINHRLRR